MIGLLPIEILFLILLTFVLLADSNRVRPKVKRKKRSTKQPVLDTAKPYIFTFTSLTAAYALVSFILKFFDAKCMGKLGAALSDWLTYHYGGFWSLIVLLSLIYMGVAGLFHRLNRKRAVKVSYINLAVFSFLVFIAVVGLKNPDAPSMRSIWTFVSLTEPLLGPVGVGFFALVAFVLTMWRGLGVKFPKIRFKKLSLKGFKLRVPSARSIKSIFGMVKTGMRTLVQVLRPVESTDQEDETFEEGQPTTPKPSELPEMDMPYLPPELEGEVETKPDLELKPEIERPREVRKGHDVHPKKEVAMDSDALLEKIAIPRVEMLRLLAKPPQSDVVDESELQQNARLIEEKLEEFGIKGRVVGFNPGPVVTLYEYELAPGIKISKVLNLADDLALRMKSNKIRIVAPLLDKGLIGIEVPNRRRRIVYFREFAEDEKFRLGRSKLKFALGVDTGGQPFYADLARMPHLLIAGATGSGKSVCINTILTSILFRAKPSEVRLLLIDPKRIELSFYEGIPHLLLPVVKERKMAGHILKQAVLWMDLRYRHFARDGVRDIESHNRTAAERGDKPIPYVGIVIDEFADLILTIGKDVEEPLARLAQMARAVGIHLVVATQRPSVDVITGIIKANFPVRIAFKVPSKVDSRTILDEIGAEKLLGMGDMLFIPPGTSEPVRLHGPFVSEEETRKIAHLFIKEYLELRMRNEFGALPDLDFLVERIVEGGFVPALTRTDEPGLEERFEMLVALVSDATGLEPEAVARKLRHIRETYYQPIPEMLEAPKVEQVTESPVIEGFDPLLVEAIRLATARGEISATMIQRKLRVGFARAARIVDQMEELGIVTPPQGSRPRKVILDLESALEKLKEKGRLRG